MQLEVQLDEFELKRSIPSQNTSAPSTLFLDTIQDTTKLLLEVDISPGALKHSGLIKSLLDIMRLEGDTQAVLKALHALESAHYGGAAKISHQKDVVSTLDWLGSNGATEIIRTAARDLNERLALQRSEVGADQAAPRNELELYRTLHKLESKLGQLTQCDAMANENLRI